MIAGNPITKKNSQRIVHFGGHPRIIPSKAYKEYEKRCKQYMPDIPTKIDFPVNVRCTYYMKTRRRVDLVNLQEATLDILTKYGVLEDDNSAIVVSMDGSRVLHDKEFPRVEILITAAR